MPESNHHKKNRSHSEWRKARNKRRANAQYMLSAEKRGMKKAMEIMQQQYESEQDALDSIPAPPSLSDEQLEELKTKAKGIKKEE